jgi:uncharacterized repeat protein (TIGR01451 family)
VNGSLGGRVRLSVLAALMSGFFIAGLVAPAGALASGLKVDFAAAAPGSYNHVTGAGGVWGDGVKSLANAKGQFACGDRVMFFARLTGLSAADNPVRLDLAFAGQPTGKGGAGFAKIVSASANTGDPANVNNGKPDVSIEKQAGGHPSADLTGTIQITNLGSGDFILRLVVELACTPGSAPTGTIHAGFVSGSAGGKPITGGTQTVPLKIADLVVTQSETVAPSPSGGDVVDDHIMIVNPGPTDVTDVVLHDTVPAGAVIDSVTTDQGSCSISGTEITCLVPHMDAGGTVDVNVIYHEPTADAAAGSPSDATASATGFDPAPANNAVDVPAPSSTPAAAALAVDIHATSRAVPLGGLETEAITITNDGPGTATGIDITNALDAAAEVIAIKPGSASCTSSTPLVCAIDALPEGATLTIELEVRPLRPGNLIDAVSVSDDDPNALLARDFATTAAAVAPRRTAARLRIVPVQPVARAGQVVEFVVTAGVTEPIPGVAPNICVSLPPGLRLTSAPSGSATPSRVCWQLTDLIRGRAQSFRFRARVGQVPRSGATLSIKGQLDGVNFTAARASAGTRLASPAPKPPPPRFTG